MNKKNNNNNNNNNNNTTTTTNSNNINNNDTNNNDNNEIGAWNIRIMQSLLVDLICIFHNLKKSPTVIVSDFSFIL